MACVASVSPSPLVEAKGGGQCNLHASVPTPVSTGYFQVPASPSLAQAGWDAGGEIRKTLRSTS
jgi:hypothetical protein